MGEMGAVLGESRSRGDSEEAVGRSPWMEREREPPNTVIGELVAASS